MLEKIEGLLWSRVALNQYREAGESCVFRGVVNDRVWLAHSVIVIKDAPKETVLLLLPGAQCVLPEGYWRWKINKDYSQGTRWHEAQKAKIELREIIWKTNRLLIFLEPEKYYSCFMFWDHTMDQFSCYYINFQLPYKRSHCGFDTLDLDLDIVIDPQYKWKWKDKKEYQRGIREGGIQAEWVMGIEQSQEEVFDKINAHKYPMDGSWVNWRPNSEWYPPTLPERWRIV